MADSAQTAGTKIAGAKIALLSGKGGTGKTLLSVNLAAVAGGASTYADCDVEEPNGHLFLKPARVEQEEVRVPVPSVDTALCNGCMECVRFCRFNALAYTQNGLLIFEELCHSCGGCVKFCPQKALTEREKTVGRVEAGDSEGVRVISGCMNTGEASGVPIIHRVLGMLPREGLSFIDCPPGSACIVMESIQGADYCVLIAEPTVFSAHNLAMVHELVTLFDKPCGAVLNKCTDAPNPSQDYCERNGIPILGRIPYDSALGALSSKGAVAARESGEYQRLFEGILSATLAGLAGVRR